MEVLSWALKLCALLWVNTFGYCALAIFWKRRAAKARYKREHPLEGMGF